jgi:glutathione S-transferase
MENLDYEFIHLDIFTEPDRTRLKDISPIMKIPVLVNPPETIYDSRQIFRYLCESSVHPKLNWDQENTLTIIDGVNDSLINLLLLKRAGINIDQDNQYISSQYQRVKLSLIELNKMAQRGDFKYWDYPSMCLYALIDWVNFRSLYDMKHFVDLNTFMGQFQNDDIVKSTDPRLA